MPFTGDVDLDPVHEIRKWYITVKVVVAFKASVQLSPMKQLSADVYQSDLCNILRFK